MLIVAYVHAYPPFMWAGGEVTLHKLLVELVHAGHDVHVVPSRDWGLGKYELDGVHVEAFTGRRDALHWIPRADVAVSHMGDVQRTVLLGRKFLVPTVMLSHSAIPIAHRWLSYRPSLAVFNTNWVARDMFPSGNTRSLVVHPLVNAAEYATKRDGNAITLINACKDKGAPVFRELAKRMPDKDFLVVAGGYGPQDLCEDLPNVRSMPQQSDMREVYRQTKLLLMPSSYESWGRVAVEAAASGIPTLASATPGLLEALGDAGTFIDTPDEHDVTWQDPIKDVDAWERGLRRLLAPRPYGQARKATIARSAEIERERLVEREAWVAAVEDLAKLRGNRGLRNG